MVIRSFCSFGCFFPLLLWWVGLQCGIYKGFCNVSNISYMNSPPLPFFFILPLPRFLEKLKWILFLHLHKHVHIFCTIFTLLSPLANTPPPVVSTFLPGKDFFHPPVLPLCSRGKRKDKKKKWHFSLFEIKLATQGVSFWCFH
jgi:hypothetical protein